MHANSPSHLATALLPWSSLLLLMPALTAVVAQAAELELRIADDRTRQPLPALVRVRDSNGTDVMPPDATEVKIARADRWFVCNGSTRVEVPPGMVEVRVEHGTEYSPYKGTLAVSETGANQLSVPLHRWIDMRQRGYVCGENHLHVPVESLGPQLVAAGLDFGTSLQWWNGPKFKVPAGHYIRMLEYGGHAVPTTVYDYEIEHAWGAVYAVGLPEPLQAEPKGSRPNLPLVRAAHEAGALISYQAGYSREALLDALLGCVDVINVCSNNFQRHRFQPRSRYSNLLNVEGFPVYPNTVEGMMRLSMDSYYRLLNCGLRLAAGAESATGAKRTPVGSNRTYVHAGDKPTISEFLRNWRKGRNFVTCGPMLFLTVNGKHEPGDTIALDPSGGEVSIRAEAFADQPLTGLEVVVNGKPLPEKPTLTGRTAVLSAKVPIREGAWIAARCTEEDRLLTDAELKAYDVGQEAQPTRVRFAHTSPVYVTVGGHGPRIAASIDEARRMLDAFDTFTMKGASQEYQEDLRTAIRTARERLGRP